MIKVGSNGSGRGNSGGGALGAIYSSLFDGGIHQYR